MPPTKPPKAAVRKAYTRADELLALWAADIRPYYDATQEQQGRFHATSVVDDEVQAVFRVFRELRHEVEDDTLSHVKVE